MLVGEATPLPTIEFSLHGTSAATANFALNIININLALMRLNYEAYIEQTIPHEYSHILVPQLFHRVPQFMHGKEWQQLMKLFGVPAKITHNYDLTGIEQTFSWACGCTVHQVKKNLHRALTRGEAYHCTECNQDVRKV